MKVSRGTLRTSSELKMKSFQNSVQIDIDGYNTRRELRMFVVVPIIFNAYPAFKLSIKLETFGIVRAATFVCMYHF